jgi:cysteine desulfurase
MPRERSYLDHNAGSPLRPEVADAMLDALAVAGNPSSVHAEGRRARSLIEAARAQVAALVGAAPERVVFTSGGTEANNLALAGALGPEARLFAAKIEHSAILDGHGLPQHRVEHPAVDEQGRVSLADLAARLNACPAPGPVAALQLANNETGVVQPVAAAADLVHAAGGIIHVDAVQAVGRIPVNLSELGTDSLAMSAHKLGGTSGVGALVLAPGYELGARLVGGGGQERGRRGGTENLAGIVGFGVAAALAARDLAAEAGRLARLRDGLEATIRALAPDAVVFGADAERLPNTLFFAIPGLRAEAALIAFDLDGIAVSSGAACSSGKVRRSLALGAMGIDPALAEGALRVSFGWNSRAEDVTHFAVCLEMLVQRLYQRGIERAA